MNPQESQHGKQYTSKPHIFFLVPKLSSLANAVIYLYEKNAIIKKYNSKKRNFRHSAAFPVEGRLKLPQDAATT